MRLGASRIRSSVKNLQEGRPRKESEKQLNKVSVVLDRYTFFFTKCSGRPLSRLHSQIAWFPADPRTLNPYSSESESRCYRIWQNIKGSVEELEKLHEHSDKNSNIIWEGRHGKAWKDIDRHAATTEESRIDKRGWFVRFNIYFLGFTD
jgi:hypothetical protein